MKLPTITVVSETTASASAPASASASTPSEEKGKVEKKPGKRVGYNYIIVKSYKKSQKNDVVKCLYIKSLTDFGFCVIKEGSFGDTKDKNGRDIIDRLKWQKQLHEELQGKIPMPRLLDHFEERSNYYLVIEHINGKSLQKIAAESRTILRQSLINGDKLGIRFLDYMIQIAGVLDTLHTEQIVHRDATPNNYMITPGAKVALIDMEMCYSLHLKYPTPAFQLGTYGYMSPQQESTQTPTTDEDIFATGAIILQLWSGVSPGKLTNEPTDALTEKIAFFIPDRQVAELVSQCLKGQDNRRPTAKQIQQVLKQYKSDIRNNVARPVIRTLPFNRDRVLTIIQDAINTIATPLLSDEEKGWFSNDVKPPVGDDKHKLRKMWYASFSRGVSGIVYMLAQANRVGMDITMTLPSVQKALDLIKQKYVDRIESANAGFHFGSDGIAAVLASAIQQGLLEPTSEQLEWIELFLQKTNQSRNVEHGIAGQGLANMTCKSILTNNYLSERLRGYADALISTQAFEGCWISGYYRHKYTRRKKKKTPYGFMEGAAGIIYFLLEYGYRYRHTESIHAAQRGLQWLIKTAKHKKGTVQWLSAKNKELNYGLTDGTAGIALTFIKAFELTSETIYKQYAVKTLNSIPACITDGNIGQRSGLSGLGEVYLEANRVFRDDAWLQRANWLVQVIVHQRKQHPKHGSYWLVEHERQPVANFMIGNSGVIHFLLRCCYPEKIKFPLMP